MCTENYENAALRYWQTRTHCCGYIVAHDVSWAAQTGKHLLRTQKMFLNKIKVLANEDTLLRTHCCRHKCFPVCPRAQHLLRTQILCPGHKKCFWFCSETFCVYNKCFPVCAAQETSWATMWPQQCVLVCQYLYENDDVTIITWFPCPSFLQTQIQNDRWLLRF